MATAHAVRGGREGGSGLRDMGGRLTPRLAASGSDLTAGGGTLKASIRGAQRRGGGVWGGVSPPHERRWSESRSDSLHQPVGKAPRTHTNPQIRRTGRPGARAGCFHHRLLTPVATTFRLLAGAISRPAVGALKGVRMARPSAVPTVAGPPLGFPDPAQDGVPLFRFRAEGSQLPEIAEHGLRSGVAL